MLVTAIKVLLVAFVLWWVITSPYSAAHEVHHIASFASNAAGSLSRFVSNL